MNKMSTYKSLYYTGIGSLILILTVFILIVVNVWNLIGPKFSDRNVPNVVFSDTIVKEMVVYDTVVQKVVVKPKETLVPTTQTVVPQVQEIPTPTLDTIK